MKRLGLLAAAFLLSSAARAQPQIALPLSRYGALDPPSLDMTRLKPMVRRAIGTAIAAAHRGSAHAKAAEEVEKRAVQAAGKARAAARLARLEKAHGLRDVSFAGSLCHYAGQMKDAIAQGSGVMLCGLKKFEGEFQNGAPSGLVTEEDAERVYLGQFRNGKEEGLGGDYARNGADAYEGDYQDGARSGWGVERDKDGAYPGRYGFARQANGKDIVLELTGLQDFQGTHWAGSYGFYSGPKIACSLIQGAVLEGSVLDLYGAKFDREGHVIEQGLYRLGRLSGSANPPC